MTYACVGQNLTYSYSASIHALLGNPDYSLCPMAWEDLCRVLTERKFEGLNITNPYKEAVLPYLDRIDPAAEKIGAVNTVVNRGGILCGFNTDFDGMKAMLTSYGVSAKGKKILILGSGGTSKTAREVFSSEGAARVRRASRHPSEADEISYGDAFFAEAEILVNATPCGTSPNLDSSAFAWSRKDFPKVETVVDVVYHPLRSRLVLDAEKDGVKAFGGLYMLVAQAAFAEERFFGGRVCGRIEDAYRTLLEKTVNTVLIGMPGSGKSTVGRLYAEKNGKPFADTDEAFCEKYGVSPADCLRTEGEDVFREKEETLIAEIVSRLRGGVIATGGGSVLRERNRRALAADGKLIFLDRPIEELPITPNRPLSDSAEKLREMASVRLPLYRAAADATLQTAPTVAETVLALERITK